MSEQTVQRSDRILLVDDNATNLQVLYKTLDVLGYTLLVAKDGETALQIAEKARPAVVLLDIRMPGMDGFEVCKRLKANSVTAESAVIFLSAADDTESKVRGLELGGVDYITKPFNTDEVVARVRTHLKILRLEQELARRNVELQDENKQILDSVTDAIISLDSEGLIRVMNPMAETMTGWTETEVIGEHIRTLNLFPHRTGTAMPMEQSLLYPAYHGGEFTHSDQEALTRRDGSQVTIALTASPRQGKGAVLVIRDISAWIENQRALQKVRDELEGQRQNLAHIERLSSGGEMAAGIAHEVNQPMTAIGNYARVAMRLLESMPESSEREKLTEVLGKMNAQTTRAGAVIERFRNYLRKPDSGRKPLNLNEVLMAVVELAEVDTRINGIEVHFEARLPKAMVRADEVQIQQVALNLIRNGMEAMRGTAQQDKGVLVQTFEDEGRVGFAVTDWGCGISDEVAETLFDPFTSSKPDGMGIGLSICEGIVQAHGGTLGHQPNEEGGTTFYCLLPPL